MQFNKETPIYIQIKEVVYNAILSGEYENGQRIPSIRDMAVSLEVNPNTVTRTYSILQEEGVIENQRGLGYFTVSDAKDVVLRQKKDEFISLELPVLFTKMEKLGIPMDKVQSLYKEFTQGD